MLVPKWNGSRSVQKGKRGLSPSPNRKSKPSPKKSPLIRESHNDQPLDLDLAFLRRQPPIPPNRNVKMAAVQGAISKRRKFVADGVFYAELNEFFQRELAEEGYSGVEVRVTPTVTDISTSHLSNFSFSV